MPSRIISLIKQSEVHVVAYLGIHYEEGYSRWAYALYAHWKIVSIVSIGLKLIHCCRVISNENTPEVLDLSDTLLVWLVCVEIVEWVEVMVA